VRAMPCPTRRRSRRNRRQSRFIHLDHAGRRVARWGAQRRGPPLFQRDDRDPGHGPFTRISRAGLHGARSPRTRLLERPLLRQQPTPSRPLLAPTPPLRTGTLGGDAQVGGRAATRRAKRSPTRSCVVGHAPAMARPWSTPRTGEHVATQYECRSALTHRAPPSLHRCQPPGWIALLR